MNRDYPARSSRRQGRGERYAEGRKQSGRGRGRQRQEPSFRLFVALDIPAEAAHDLLRWQQEYLAADRSLRLTPKEQLHVTLAFLGQKNEAERDLAASLLERLTMRESFEVKVTGLAALPRNRSPRVIAAACEESSGRLAGLHDELVAALVAEGLYQKEKRPFFPHATVARSRGCTRFDPAETAPEPFKFTAVRVTLYNSVLQSSGALHEALKTVQLNQ